MSSRFFLFSLVLLFGVALLGCLFFSGLFVGFFSWMVIS